MSVPDSYNLPKDRLYHPGEHMWVLENGDSTVAAVAIGIDEMHLDNLGELAYVTLREPGTEVKAGESIGTLEAAKMTAEIFAPLSGTILQTNQEVVARPLLVNEAPYTDGWLIHLEPAAWSGESADLIGGDAIDPWAAAELQRYKEQSGNTA